MTKSAFLLRKELRFLNSLSPRSIGPLCLVVAALSMLTREADAQEFWQLPINGWALSGDGQVVVGKGPLGPARWTRSGGMEYLGAPTVLGEALGANFDGSVVVGRFYNCQPPCNPSPFRWSATAGFEVIPAFAQAIGVSATGDITLGNGNGGWIYSPAAGVTHFPGNLSFEAISADGLTAVGMGGYYRINEGSLHNFQPLWPCSFNAPVAVSADGQVFVGIAVQTCIGRTHAVRWNLAGQPTDLGGGFTAIDLNHDGSVIVGEGGVWLDQQGPIPLAPWLKLQGVDVPPGAMLHGAIAVSDDGRTFLGESWLATVPCFRVITAPPTASRVCNQMSSLSMTIGVVGEGPFSYQWTRNGVPIEAAANPTALTPTLTISGQRSLMAGDYACIVANACSIATVGRNTVELACPTDVNCNGTNDINNIFEFLNSWFASSTAADFDSSGTVNFNDIFSFLNAWFAGC